MDWALVPCGKCPTCSARRASQWSFRLMQQEKISINAQFITLTYATQHVPITKNGRLTVCKNDIQLFFKRLRKAHELVKDYDVETYPIKYYCVAEYGSKTSRPHYHIIMFNARTELIQKAWNLGEVHYGTVNGASIGYTLKYISKPKTAGKEQGDDRNREFCLMSKGLGKNYLTPKMVKWHMADMYQRLYCNLPDGKKVSMPRYYKDKCYEQAVYKKISLYQQDKIKLAEQKAIKKHGSITELEKWRINKAQAAIRNQETKNRKLQKL